MTWPERIRSAVIALFGSRLVRQLQESLDATAKERDYFRAKVDRLEEKLYGIVTQPRAPRPPINTTPVGRKSWAQVQMEHLTREQEEYDRKIRKQQGRPDGTQVRQS